MIAIFDERALLLGHRSAGVHRLLLPNLNSIEQAFAKLKVLLRSAGERTLEATWRRIGALLTHSECASLRKRKRDEVVEQYRRRLHDPAGTVLSWGQAQS